MENHQVIKLGAACLFDSEGRIDHPLLRQKAEEIKGIEEEQNTISTLVVSGAIPVGKMMYDDRRPNEELTPEEMQFYAGVGQIGLMEAYGEAFKDIYNISQLLITSKDTKEKEYMGHIKNLVNNSAEKGVIILANRNDPVDFEQLTGQAGRAGPTDNETTSLDLALCCDSKRLVILGRYEGFLNPEGELIREINGVTEEHYSMCNDGSSQKKQKNFGFYPKLYAADLLSKRGIDVMIGSVERPLSSIVSGEYGTRFRMGHPDDALQKGG
ncbi:MAG: hypothetical protein R6U32_02245 [Candidatus Woesearchaeota archaeon]